MGYKLRGYQQEAVNKILNHWKDSRTCLLVQATGTGKTIVFSEVAKNIVEQGGRALILAHREELIEQAIDKIFLAQGLNAGLEKASSHANGEPVVVGSVQTLKNPARLKHYNPDYFTHIIIDEAHHSIAPQYQSVINYFKNAKILGVTATPYRGDKKDLSEVFDSITYEYSLIEAIDQGFLSPIVFKLIPIKIDLNTVNQSMGDFQVNGLNDALDPYLEEIVDVMVKECRDRKTVVFLPLISTSIKFTDMLKDRGINAVEINGNTQNRKQILDDFDKGRIQVLCNSMLLTEGWDCPSLDCIVNLRPTRSETLYTQIIGRGTRKAPGKKNLLVLDFLWQSEKYDLCKPSILVAQNKEQEAAIDKRFQEDEEIDLKEALEKAKDDIVAQRESKLAKELAEKRHRKGKLIDPIQYGLSIKSEDLVNYTPQFMWEKMPLTPNQEKVLKNNDIDLNSVPNRGYASRLIDRLITRSKLNFSTPRQIRLLERYGFKDVGTWKKKDATKIISLIANNKWKVPRFITPSTFSPRKVQ